MNDYAVKVSSPNYGEHYLGYFKTIDEAEKFSSYASEEDNLKVIVKKNFKNIHNLHLKNCLSEFEVTVELNY